MFKGLKDKVGKSITQANNRLRVTKNETPQNANKTASVQSSSPSPSLSASLIDLNTDSTTGNHNLTQTYNSNQSTDQSPAILNLSNYESSEDISINSKSKTKNEDNHGKTSKNTPSTPANPHSTVRHRNDSLTSQMSDSFFFNAGSSPYIPSQQFLHSDVESVASEVEDHNLIDSLGVGRSGGRDRVGSGRSDGGSGRTMELVSKEDLFKVFKKIYAKNQKYSGKYSQLVGAYRESEKERGKLKEVLTKCQDKAIQRISELKEQLSLKQMAMNDVEVNYTMMLQEKQELVKVLQMQVAVLKEGIKVNKEGEIVEVGESEEEKQEIQDGVVHELNLLKEKNAKLTKLLGNCKSTILEHRDEIKKVMTQRDALKTEINEKEELQTLKQQLTERVEDLQEELDNYKEEKRRWMEGDGKKDGGLLEEDMKRLIEEKMDLEEKLATLGEENKKLRKKVVVLETEVQQSQSLIDVSSITNVTTTASTTAMDNSMMDIQTSSSSSSFPSSSLFGEHRTIVPTITDQQCMPVVREDDQLVVDKLISENYEIKKDLIKFKNQAKIFKNICQCVFKAVVIDSNMDDNNPNSNPTNAHSNTSTLQFNNSQPTNNFITPGNTINGGNNTSQDEIKSPKGTNKDTKLEADVQALYTHLYDHSKYFIDDRTDFLYSNNDLRKSIVKVLKSGLDKSMLKLKERVDGVSSEGGNVGGSGKHKDPRNKEDSRGNKQESSIFKKKCSSKIETVNNTTNTETVNIIELTPETENEEDWVTEEEEEEDDKVCGSYIDDYDNLALQQGGDEYLKRLLLKWKESCEKYEVLQSRRESSLLSCLSPLSQQNSQQEDLIQVDQCTPILSKSSRNQLVVINDNQVFNGQEVKNGNQDFVHCANNDNPGANNDDHVVNNDDHGVNNDDHGDNNGDHGVNNDAHGVDNDAHGVNNDAHGVEVVDGVEGVAGSNYCDTDDDKLIKGSLLERYEDLRGEHDRLLERYECLRGEMEGLVRSRNEVECEVESDEVKAQNRQVLNSDKEDEERLVKMSELNADINNKYSTLCEEMVVIQDGFNNALKEKIEVEKEMMIRSDEMGVIQEQNHALSFESEAMKNELSKMKMELKVGMEDYEQLKVEYEQLCEEAKKDKGVIGKLKSALSSMERNVEGVNVELEGVKHDNGVLTEAVEGLKRNLHVKDKKLVEKDEIGSKLNEDFERLKNESSKRLKEIKVSEKRFSDASIRLSELELLHKQLLNKCDESQKEITEFISQKNKLTNQFEDSEKQNKILTSELEEWKKNDEIISKMEELKGERDRLREEVALLKETNDQFQIRVEVVQDDLQRSMDGRDAEDDEMSLLQEKYDGLMQKYHGVEDEVKKKEELEVDIGKVKEKLEDLTNSFEGLEKERDNYSEEARISIDRKEEAENNLKENELKVVELSKQIESLNKQLETKNNESFQEVETIKLSHKYTFELVKKKFEEMKDDKKRILSENEEKVNSLNNELVQVKKEKEDLIKSNDEIIKLLTQEKATFQENEARITVLKTELEHIKKETEDLITSNNDRILLLTEEKTKLEESYKVLNLQYKEISDTKSTFDSDNEKDILDLNTSIKDLRQENSYLLRKKEEFEKINEEHNKEINVYKESENKLKDEIESVKRDLAEKVEAVLKYEQRVEEVELEGKNVMERAKELKEDNCVQKDELLRLNGDIDELKNDKINLSERVSLLQKKVTKRGEEYELKVSALRSEYEDRLSNQESEVVLKLKEKEENGEKRMNKILNGKNEEINILKQNLKDKLSEIEGVKVHADEFNKNVEMLKVEISEVKSERDELKRDNNKKNIELEKVHSNSSKSTQEVNTKVADIQSEKELLIKENEALKMEKETLIVDHQGRLDESGKRHGELEVSMKEKEEAWVDKMNEFKKKAENKIKQIRKQQEDYAKEVSVKEESSNINIQQLKEDLSLKEKDISELNIKYEDVNKLLEQEKEEIAEKSKGLIELKERLAELQAENKRLLQEERANKIEQVDEIKVAEVEMVKSECKLLQGESVSLNENIACLQKEIDNLKIENDELKSKSSNNVEVNEKELRKELKSLSKQYNRLEEQYAELEVKTKFSLDEAEKEKKEEIERVEQEYTDEMAERDNENTEKIRTLMKDLQASLAQKEKQYQCNFTKTLETSEQESESRLRELESDLKETRQDVREKDEQLDDASHQLLTLHDKLSELQEFSGRCHMLEGELDVCKEEKAEMEGRLAEKNKKVEENQNSMNHREVQKLSLTGSQISLDSSCSIIPVEFEYLKAVLYKYMTANPDKETLAKVLCKIMKYSENEERSVLTYNRRS